MSVLSFILSFDAHPSSHLRPGSSLVTAERSPPPNEAHSAGARTAVHEVVRQRGRQNEVFTSLSRGRLLTFRALKFQCITLSGVLLACCFA